jgi:hypothetical protein
VTVRAPIVLNSMFQCFLRRCDYMNENLFDSRIVLDSNAEYEIKMSEAV